MLHIEHFKEINQIVDSKNYSKLLDYKNFHLEHLSEVLIECHDIVIQKHILNNAVNFEITQNNVYKPIHYVCQNKNGLDMLKLLIENKVDLESNSNYFKESPIHYVCQNKNGFKMLKLLIENKVNLECVNQNKEKPIHFVCLNENGLDMLKLLIENKVSLESTDVWGSKPIHFACQNKCGLDMIKVLIETNVNVDPKIKTIYNKNWIDYLDQENIIKLLDENIISVRQCGYIIKYLEKEQDIQMCQDSIDHDPDNKQYIRKDLLRYFQ